MSNVDHRFVFVQLRMLATIIYGNVVIVKSLSDLAELAAQLREG
jgi:hypothetical protein